MTKLNIFTTEELEMIKEKMERSWMKINENVVLELLKELEELDLLEELETELTVENIGFSKNGDGEVVKLGETEYLVLTDEEANELLRERIEELIDWNGFSLFNELDATHYMDKDILEEMMADDLKWWVSGLSEEELKEEMKYYEVENEEDLIKEKIDHIGAIDYWLDFMDEDDLVKTLIDREGFDTDEMIEDFISWYGRGHELATYDGYEIELSTDDETFYAYRIN